MFWTQFLIGKLTMEWLQIMQQISILLGIWVAIYSIDAWRREHIGKRQIELAEDTLALFYEAADAINHIRHPESHSSETDNVERGEHELESYYQARKNAYVVFHRHAQYQELFNKLHASRYRFMSLVGKEESKPFDELRVIIREILFAAKMLAKLWPKENFRNNQQETLIQGRIERFELIFWEGSAESDPINPRIDEIVEKIENTCQSIIAGKNTLHGVLNKKI